LFVVILNYSCSASKNTGRIADSGKLRSTEKVLENVENNNLTNESFFIQKAEISITTTEETRKFLGSLKFEFPDKFLLSLRTGSGIEFARIFLSGDTLMINDRINKILHVGAPDDLNFKFGLSPSLIPLVLGDIVGKIIEPKMLETFQNKLFDVNCVEKGTKLRYTIDSSKDKISAAIILSSSGKEKLAMEFGKFISTEQKIIPGMINIEANEIHTSVVVKFRKVDLYWKDKIEFLPGKGYQILKIS
jgi:hypothetical protein